MFAGQVPPPSLPTPVVLSGWKYAFSLTIDIVPGASGGTFAFCPAGTEVISGGFSTFATTEFVITQNGPLTGPHGGASGWTVSLNNLSTADDAHLQVRAVCIAAQRLETQ